MTAGTAARRGWVGAALLTALAYAVIGKVFALPTDDVQAWRLAAWVIPAFVVAAAAAFVLGHLLPRAGAR